MPDQNVPEIDAPNHNQATRRDPLSGQDAQQDSNSEHLALLRQVQVLQAISEVALEQTKLDDLLPTLLRRIQTMLAVDNVALLLLTSDGDALTLYRVSGPEAAVLGLVRIPIGHGVAGTIAATRQPLIIENLATVPVANPFLREHFHSLLGVPLLADNRLIGVLHIDTVRVRQFTDEDSQMVQALAVYITSAIVRAQQDNGEQQRRLDAERQRAILQAATERMDGFLGIASHELRTPITNLSLTGQLLDLWLYQQHSRHPDESEGAYLVRAAAALRPPIQRFNSGVQRLNRLVGDLLDTARLREQRVEFHLQRLDLTGLVQGVVTDFQLASSSRSIHLSPLPLSLIIEGDPDRIGQVVSNYLTNALKYAPPERPITAKVERADAYVRITVHDEGPGIPEDKREHIWERFYRAPGTSPQSGSLVGLGLGLYISRSIIERHHGHVGVISVYGHGSTFWFTLPLVAATSAA